MVRPVTKNNTLSRSKSSEDNKNDAKMIFSYDFSKIYYIKNAIYHFRLCFISNS